MTNSMNPEQQEAVNHMEGPLLVLAGAGSGKTRIVTHRIVNLIDNGVPASEILAVTFTNKAAGEMKERVSQLTYNNVLISTFHSLGARILRESIDGLGYKSDYTIYDEEDALKLIRSCLNELGIRDKEMQPKDFKYLISNAKNQMLAADEVDNSGEMSPAEQVFPAVYEMYQKKLKEYNALDFDDLLYLTVRLFQERKDILEMYQNRWKYLLIDEYQDTNAAQYMMTNLLVEKSQNLFVVGDPDQSIYSWRGADISNILNFSRDYPAAKTVKLEQNYRSTSNILDAANAVIQNNNNRYEKDLWSALGEGEKIFLHINDTEKEEANYVVDTLMDLHHGEGIPLNEFVIFYRTNFQSRVVEDKLLFQRIPYVIVGGISFYQRREIKDILAFMRFVLTGTDFVSFARTINLPKRGIGDASVEKIRQGASTAGVSILEFCERLISGEGGSAGVRLTAKQKEGIKQYCELIRELRQVLANEDLRALVMATIRHTGYLGHLKTDPDTYEDRKSNLEELVAKASEWERQKEDPSLEGFLEELSLKSSLDEAQNFEESVKLMTVHNGKGLEFRVAFIVGMEEDLFPHVNSRGNEQAIEEERRLCYVGMTRAREFLYLSASRSRFLWGGVRSMRPSRFLNEVPREYLEII